MAKITTTAPDEVKRVITEIANLCRVYADDQIGAQRWQQTKRERQFCAVRAKVYNDLADELDAIGIVKSNNN